MTVFTSESKYVAKDTDPKMRELRRNEGLEGPAHLSEGAGISASALLTPVPRQRNSRAGCAQLSRRLADESL